MSVLIVKNITREGPASLVPILRSNGIKYKVVNLDYDERFPDPLNYKALFVFGGPDSANDHTLKMTEEVDQVRHAIEGGVPYFGMCLGMQVLAKASGADILKSPTKEVGWRAPNSMLFSMTLTQEGKKDPLFKGLKEEIKPIFHLHGETVSISEKMTLLATGEFCKVQAIKVGSNAYGLQGHMELDYFTFKTWLDQDPDLGKLKRKELEQDYQIIRGNYESHGRTILTNFLRIAQLID